MGTNPPPLVAAYIVGTLLSIALAGPRALAESPWTAMAPLPGSCGRSGRPVVWTGPPLNRVLVWGGLDSADRLATDGCSYDPATNSWTFLSKTRAPTPRAGHSAVWTGTEMIVWGGSNDGVPTTGNGTGGRYNPATDTWSPVSKVGGPRNHLGHFSAWTGTKMIVLDGWGNPGPQTRGTYDPVTNTWSPMSTTAFPAGQGPQHAVWTGSRLLVWGGVIFGDVYLAGALYDPVADSWAPMGGTPPSVHAGSTSVWTGTRLLVWGGRTPDTLSGPGIVSIYDPEANTWTSTLAAGAPLARTEHSAVWTGSRMVVWGGQDRTPSGDYLHGDGALFDPAGNTWSPIQPEGSPSPRLGHSAEWTGSEMLVWGGSESAFSYLNDGGRWKPQDPSEHGPIADFKVGPLSPYAGEAAAFTDLSTGPPTSWAWAFGDGAGSTSQNPIHAFSSPGPFLVSLTVSDGTTSSTRSSTVVVTPPGCAPGETVLCLDGNRPGDRRFEIAVDWSTIQAGGQGGKGKAVSASPIGFTLGGLFWFLDAANPEMLVKVVNGCYTNQKLWVFMAATTNVGLNMKVTDTRSGLVRSYSSPDLTPAQPVLDVKAFACN